MDSEASQTPAMPERAQQTLFHLQDVFVPSLPEKSAYCVMMGLRYGAIGFFFRSGRADFPRWHRCQAASQLALKGMCFLPAGQRFSSTIWRKALSRLAAVAEDISTRLFPIQVEKLIAERLNQIEAVSPEDFHASEDPVWCARHARCSAGGLSARHRRSLVITASCDLIFPPELEKGLVE